MKKVAKFTGASIITAAILILLALAIGCGFAAFVAAEREANVESSTKNTLYYNTLDFSADVGGISASADVNVWAQPKVYPQRSRGGVVIEQSSARVLLDENMRAKCYPASTTKVLTALAVLNNADIKKIVTVPKEAVGIEGSSIYLKEGEKLTVEDLLYGLMLRSGNDAAVALAIAVSGSVEDFASLMNETAKACGALDSNFVNPHGLHDDNHYTTAYDLALITAEAYKNEDFKRIVNTSTVKIGGGSEDEPRFIGNKNKLLKMYEGANGVKTGYTKKSGRCLVGGAERDGMQLIAVVLNYNDMWNDTMRLLDYGFDNYELAPLETAIIPIEGAKPIEINAELDKEGNFIPLKYPLLKGGREYIKLAE